MKQTHFCVISHTHWDREWALPLERFRRKLTDMMDRLFGILAAYPDYVFHLDAQTILLEDYLAVRPDRRPLLESYVRSGNIVVGPWYMQNDFFLTSGEATIRNLTVGSELARRFGRCASVGYAPDQFGIIGQLPQILNGFGIRDLLFGRGYSHYERRKDGEIVRVPQPLEFRFATPSGAEVLAVHLAGWYNNAQRVPADPDKCLLLLRLNERALKPISATSRVLLMNGVDILEAQDDLLPALESVRPLLAECADIRQCSMEDFVRQVRADLAETQAELPVVRGELREGSDYELLRGCYASRIYLKQRNVRAQTALESVCEPMCAVLAAAGFRGAFDDQILTFVWKLLLANHPHDSICGCSCDAVHRHMEDRFARVEEIVEDLRERALETAAHHFAWTTCGPKDYVLALFNGTETDYRGPVEATLTFLAEDRVRGFVVTDETGATVDCFVKRRARGHKVVFTPLNLPGILDVDVYEVVLPEVSVRGMSYQGLRVAPASAPAPRLPRERPLPNACQTPLESVGLETFGIENEYLRLRVKEGRVLLVDKESGRTFADAIFWEDSADRGDSYVYEPTEEAPRLFAPGGAGVSCDACDPFRKTLRLVARLRLPKGYDFRRMRARREETTLRAELSLTLRRGCRGLEISYRFRNTVKDHRLRLCFRMPSADGLVTDAPFEAVRHTAAEVCPLARSRNVPNSTFFLKEDGTRAMCVLTEGQHDCEELAPDLAALTVVRATGMISRGPAHRELGGEIWQVPENQCLRTLTGRVVLLFGPPKSYARWLRAGKLFRSGIAAAFTSVDPRHLCGGRFAVQDASLAELYFVPDPHAEVRLERNRPALRTEGETVVCSAFRFTADGRCAVVRLQNFSGEERRGALVMPGVIRRSDLRETRGEALGRDRIEITFAPYELKTFLVEPKGD